MTNRYVEYPTSRHESRGTLQAQVSSQIAAGAAAVTVTARNQTGRTITLIAAQGWSSTAHNQAGTQLEVTNAAAATHLTAPIDMQTAAQVNVAGGIEPTNNTVADGAEILFTFTNAAGGGATAMTDPQGTVWYNVDFMAT